MNIQPLMSNRILCRIAVVLTFGMLLCGRVLAEVRLPAVFSDNMVVQQASPLVVWGWAEAGEKVRVSLPSQEKEVAADPDGSWRIQLDPVKIEGSFEIVIKGNNTIVIKNVLAGEVWLASGQSNMHWPLSHALNGDKEVAGSNYPEMRLFHVPPETADEPARDCDAKWVVCGPETSGGFSAVAFFFGRHLHEKLGCPVGLIAGPYGGTFIEAWMSDEALRTTEDYPYIMNRFKGDEKRYNEYLEKYEKERAAWEENVQAAKEQGLPVPPEPQLPIEAIAMPRNYPSRLFNAMINPVIPYTIQGVVWYQGESNALAGRSAQYARLFPAMLNDWRKWWGYDFPFYSVQLAPFANNPWQPDDANNCDWAELRDVQQEMTAMKNCEMAVTVDLGDAYDIHPKNKQDVGRRLGLIALTKVYGYDVTCSGPVYESMEIVGNRIRIFFKSVADGLVLKGDRLEEFTIAGQDGVFVKAHARIVGKDRVEVWSKKVAYSDAVRYGWRRCPDKCNLYNSAGLPASPFRTDDFPLVSRDNK